jgi:hypothetical protein
MKSKDCAGFYYSIFSHLFDVLEISTQLSGLKIRRFKAHAQL